MAEGRRVTFGRKARRIEELEQYKHDAEINLATLRERRESAEWLRLEIAQLKDKLKQLEEEGK